MLFMSKILRSRLLLLWLYLACLLMMADAGESIAHTSALVEKLAEKRLYRFHRGTFHGPEWLQNVD